VLVIKQGVKVTFRDPRPGDDIQHAGAGKAVFTKEGKCRFEHALTDGARDVLGFTVGQE
jgi:hypothetical protein